MGGTVTATPIAAVGRASFVATALVGVAASAVVYAVNPTEQPLTPPCPLQSTFGLFCPGCGGTRAAHFLLHGDIATALTYNAAFVVLLSLLAVVGWRWAKYAWSPERHPFRLDLPTWGAWSILGGIILFAVLRNVTAGPFPLLPLPS